MRNPVRQIREDFRFTLKPSEPIAIGGKRRRQNLDRALTLELGIGRPKHQAHAAFAYLRRDLVDAETGAGSEGQTLGL